MTTIPPEADSLAAMQLKAYGVLGTILGRGLPVASWNVGGIKLQGHICLSDGYGRYNSAEAGRRLVKYARLLGVQIERRPMPEGTPYVTWDIEGTLDGVTVTMWAYIDLGYDAEHPVPPVVTPLLNDAGAFTRRTSSGEFAWTGAAR